MRLAASLGLDTDNREYRLLLAQHRPPPLLLSPSRSATPALQRVPVGFRTSPAIVETPTDGCSAEADALIEELQATSADFRRLHADMEARSHGVGIKRLTHPEAGLPTFEYAAFSVDGADGLTLIVFSPASDIDAAKVASTFPQHAPIPLTADLRT